MSRRVRFWVAAVLAAILALPAAPVLARHGQGDGCCAAMTVPMTGDCATHRVSADRATPACDDDGGAPASSPKTTLCPHCVAAASVAGIAFGNAVVDVPPAAAPFVVPPEVASFIPAAPVDRLDRPPKLRSF